MSVINVVCNDIENNPECPHGPTLKFVRLLRGKQTSFYACSAYRDRKDCSFYHLDGEKITEGKKLAWELEKKKILPEINYEECKDRLKKFESLTAKERMYCHSCAMLIFNTELETHKNHNIQGGISNDLLRHPSKILKPKENAKQEAQHFFSTKCTQLIVNNLEQLNVDKVLCVGTPRVHEEIQERRGTMQSLLLDFDHRYFSFYSKHEFCWFNMFNCHFLRRKSKLDKQRLETFISEGKVALVTDPPFGGRVEALSCTIDKLSQMYSKANSTSEMLVIWIFPYFMEPQILSACPNLTMLDYKVDYENHQQFQNNNKGRKHGSPIRIFTNIKPSEFPLPLNEGYRLCKICQRWVSLENKHCGKCGLCTSKDGQTYKHCNLCRKCVKPTWQHCETCERCVLSDHDCIDKVSGFANKSEEPKHKRSKLMLNKKKKRKKFL